MAANVLKSKHAIQMSVFVVRAFVRLRELATTHHELASKIKELEQRVGKHDAEISAIIKAIRDLMSLPAKPRKPIGFQIEEPKSTYRVRK